MLPVVLRPHAVQLPCYTWLVIVHPACHAVPVPCSAAALLGLAGAFPAALSNCTFHALPCPWPPAQVSPAEHSQRFVAAAGGFSTPDAVQKGGCHVAAMQIAAEPLLRQEVRKQYQVGPAGGSSAPARRRAGTLGTVRCGRAQLCTWPGFWGCCRRAAQRFVIHLLGSDLQACAPAGPRHHHNQADRRGRGHAQCLPRAGPRQAPGRQAAEQV